MTANLPSYPRLALPFTIVADGDVVHLIAGEDIRYTIAAAGIANRVAAVLSRFDGSTPLGSLLIELVDGDRITVIDLVQRLQGERIVVDGPVEARHVSGCYGLVVQGSGSLVERLTAAPLTDSKPVAILCQDVLDYHAVLEFNRRCLTSGGPWMWVTTGPASRAFVSPVFLPTGRPCLACLLRHFQRLSPTPHIYDSLVRHAKNDGSFATASFPENGVVILEHLVRWKLQQFNQPTPSTAVFRLHVLELESMEVNVHRVLLDPNCPECTDAPMA